MPNTITNNTIVLGHNRVIQQILIDSDGSEESNYVCYDSSVVAALLGKSDSLSSTILKMQIVSQNAANATDLTFKYHANTPVIAIPLTLGPASTQFHTSLDFSDHGGVINFAGAGKNGDVTLDTANLDNGDRILIILDVKPY